MLILSGVDLGMKKGELEKNFEIQIHILFLKILKSYFV